MLTRKIVIFFTGILLISNTLYSQSANHWETIIYAKDTWKYIVPNTEPDADWRNPGFNDNAWNQGLGGFGYGDNDDLTTLPAGTKSAYFRRLFEVSDTSKIVNMLLNADYDDAFVAFINGVEICRGGGLSENIPTINSPVSFTHEAVMYAGGLPEMYLLKKDVIQKFLVNGPNVLCIQLYNDQITSSDLSGNFYLSAGIKDESVFYGETPSWFEIPLEFGTSNIPIITINTNGLYIGDEPKIAAQLSILDKGTGNINSLSDIPVLTCKIGIEYRGSTSQGFPKKSYGFETRTELDSNLNVSLLGLPAENDWVLYAPYDDKTFLRDILAYKLGQQMGHYEPRFVFCELYLNGNYQGVYVLLEKIKQGINRVNIANLKTTDISGKDLSGGYIFKIDKATGSNNDGWTSLYHPNNLVDKNINFLYHYPKPDVIKNEQKSYIRFFVNQFETALASSNYTDELLGYRKFIDVTSFIDYFIINEISKNVDGYRISSYFHKDREDRINKIVAGPLWDYNLGFGNADYYDGFKTTDWVINCIPEDDYWQVPFWWQRLLNDPAFYSSLKDRYTLLRKNILKSENLNTFIDSLVTVLQDPQKRNYQKWPILGTYTWPNPFIGATYQQEIDYMKGWITDRLIWIDSKLLILDNPEINQIVNEIAVVYPNPFTTNLFVEILPSSKAKNATLEIFDLTGKKMFFDQLTVNDTEKTIYSLTENWQSVTSLASGMYLLRIKLDSGKEFQAKILKR